MHINYFNWTQSQSVLSATFPHKSITIYAHKLKSYIVIVRISALNLQYLLSTIIPIMMGKS